MMRTLCLFFCLALPSSSPPAPRDRGGPTAKPWANSCDDHASQDLFYIPGDPRNTDRDPCAPVHQHASCFLLLSRDPSGASTILLTATNHQLATAAAA
ncbi:hypothetical protein OPV22_027542 [Ensete ventricosum]|uniref:Secreted protein n=1 Tax=Ensete ventricosum TaxID=4639 RepID=A0AAV8Q7Y8_ENSVE|nr:hypothetical protein OPV22_027542 [Ensete ventricosum]